MVRTSPLPIRLIDQTWTNRVPSPAHDSLTAAMRRALIESNPYSYLAVTRSQQDLPPEIDATDEQLLLAGKASLATLINAGAFGPDSGALYFVYRLSTATHTQTGVVGGVSVSDFTDGSVRVHEQTHPERAVHLSRHFEVVGVQSSPIAVAHTPSDEIAEVINLVTAYDLPNVTVWGDDGLTQQIWPVDKPDLEARITEAMVDLDLYLIDGHHRAEASVQYHDRTKDECSEYVLSAWFSTEEMANYPHHRTLSSVTVGESLVDDLRLFTPVRELPAGDPLNEVADTELMLYHMGRWYGVTAPVDPSDPPELGVLDQTRLEHLLSKMPNEIDARSGIQYRPGILPTTTLAGETDLSGGCLFLMRQVSMEQLLKVADAGQTMPPKSTYFSPKLRSGVFLRPCSVSFEY